MLLQKLRRDVLLRTCPLVVCLINDEHCVEPIRVSLLQVVEFLLKEDIVRRDVGVDELELGLVFGLRKCMS